MPTPVQHLVVADAILTESHLPAAVRAWLHARHAAFRFGNTAPDVQTVSGQPREATHFFNVPLNSARPAHRIMFEAHPDLSRAERLRPEHAAFIAGYIAHLTLDVLWVQDIFQPVFGLDAGWATFHDRLFLHNVLRAWCDRSDQARLAAGSGEWLAAADPDHWLPFTDDRYLHRWRDVLVEQFAPGATIRTVEVFARRGRVAPEAFERVLGSDEQMDELIFRRLPRHAIDEYYARSIARSVEAIADYLKRV